MEGNKIKSRGESHSRGWRAPPGRLGREQGAAPAADCEGPWHVERAHTVPRSERGRRVTMVARLGGGVHLAATWAHLGVFPLPYLRGAGREDEEGRVERRLPPVCSRSIRRRGGRAGVSPRRPRSNVVRPRRTNRRGAGRHGNSSIRRGRSAALAAKSHTRPGAGRRPLLARAGNLEFCY